MRFIVRVIISALALWLTTLLLAPHISVQAFPPGETLQVVLTYLGVALIFGLVNGLVGNAIRIVAFPVYILTLGLAALVVNALMLILAAWITNLTGFGLRVENFWWGVLGALVLGFISWLIGILLRPFMKESRSKRDD